MRKLAGRLRAYVITDERSSRGRTEEQVVRLALQGGATAIQLRSKSKSTSGLLHLGRALREICHEREALFLINDRPDIALAVDADGVHVGQEDIPVAAARRVVGHDKIVGASAGTAAEAREAEADGADYVGVGPVFPTLTKSDAGEPIGLSGLSRICREVKIPVVGIGGINAGNAGSVLRSGAAGVAVISAVVGAEDIEKAASDIVEATGGPSVGSIGEFGLISRLRDLIAMGPARHELAVDIGDDAACISWGPEEGHLLAACDMLLEGIHFDLRHVPAYELGWKSIAVNASDIAAMGGIPRYAMVSLGLTGDESVGFIEELYRGMIDVGTRLGVRVIGGDTVRSAGGLAVSVGVFGGTGTPHVPPKKRSDANLGDAIMVTGGLGRSALGLRLLQGAGLEEMAIAAGITRSQIDEFKTAHLKPWPRVAEGRVIASFSGGGAMIDVSDGLASEVNHITSKSEIGARIIKERLPLDEAYVDACGALEISPVDLALYGGEDYELLFTVRQTEVDDVISALKTLTGTVATVIGEVVPAELGVSLVSLSEGVTKPLLPLSYEHFKSR